MYRSRRRGVHQENDAAMVRLEKEGGQHKRAQHIGFWNHALFMYFCCNCMLNKNRMVSTTMIGSGCGGRKPKAAANYFLSELSLAQ